MDLSEQIQQTATSLGIPPALALSVAQRESGLDPSAIGSSGEVGLFQLLPSTAASLGVNPYNVSENISGGLTYLKQMFNQFGSWDLALAAYNAGPTQVASGSIPFSTQQYVASILGTSTIYLPALPTYSIDVWGEPIYDFPWWVLAIGLGALVFLALRKRS